MIKDTNNVLPVKDGPQNPVMGNLFLWILPVARCPRIKIVKWEVAFSEKKPRVTTVLEIRGKSGKVKKG